MYRFLLNEQCTRETILIPWDWNPILFSRETTLFTQSKSRVRITLCITFLTFHIFKLSKRPDEMTLHLNEKVNYKKKILSSDFYLKCDVFDVC